MMIGIPLYTRIIQKIENGAVGTFAIFQDKSSAELCLLAAKRMLPVVELCAKFRRQDGSMLKFDEKNFGGEILLCAEEADPATAHLILVNGEGKIMLSSEQDLFCGELFIFARKASGESGKKAFGIHGLFDRMSDSPSSSLLWDSSPEMTSHWYLQMELEEANAHGFGIDA